MLPASMFSWTYLGVSLLLCSLLLNQYETFPDATIREVFGGSILASFAFATIMSLIARRHAYTSSLERMTSPLRSPTMAASFGILSGKMDMGSVSLREATLGSAFSVSLNGQGVVAVSHELASTLSSEETEAVLAHELSHIKNGDSFAKGMARLCKAAFPFDPVLHLVEAAVHRERELWADRVAVKFTGRPLALASALVKANSRPTTASTHYRAGFFVGGSGRGLFSHYPDLEKRVDALLEIAHQTEIASPTIVA